MFFWQFHKLQCESPKMPFVFAVLLPIHCTMLWNKNLEQNPICISFNWTWWHHISIQNFLIGKGCRPVHVDFFFQLNLLPPYLLSSQGDNNIKKYYRHFGISYRYRHHHVVLTVLNLQSRDWGYSGCLLSFNSELAKGV